MGEPLRVAIVGCGDVAARHYLPALEALDGEARIVALVDPRLAAADRLVASVERWSPGVRAYPALEPMLEEAGAEAAFQLAPAPEHARINRRLLEAGLHLYSEKPIASTVDEADALIALARASGRRFLCAPGSAVSPRIRWLAGLAASTRFGRATLAVAHHADPGPAAWREYTGDPSVFYREGVGPVFDHGVYRLHELTTVLGPVRRVQAMGGISARSRVVRGGPLRGRTIEVTTPDHVLAHLEFESGALGQLLSSFGTPETRAPWLELHFERATLSFTGKSWEADAPVALYVDDDGPVGLEGWIERLAVPNDAIGVVESGATHFVRHVAGREPPILTAEHARHVLDVILGMYGSMEDGRVKETVTTFDWPVLAPAGTGDREEASRGS